MLRPLHVRRGYGRTIPHGLLGVPAVLGALVAALACRDRPAPGAGPYAAIVAQEVPAIERAAGIRFKRPPRVQRRTRDQVRAFVLREIADSAAQRELAGTTAAYRLLGLVPDTLDMRRLLVDLLTEQVIGFYDPATRVLYVVDGAPREALRLTVTHELVHALQDQYISLDSLQNIHGDDDRAMAAQAVFEGQATYDQLAAMLGPGNVAVALPGGWDRVRDLIRNNREAMPVYARAPLVIQETLIFPYLSGAEFVRTFAERRPRAQPWEPLPASTEQVLHPQAYFRTPRDTPITVRFAPRGIASVYENNLGEFVTRLLLFQHLGNQSEATRGAAGWGGDRYVVWGDTARGTAGASIAWATAWDTREDAADFYGLLQRVAEARDPARRGRRMAVTTGEIGGRAVVLLVDTPASAAPPPVTLADVRIGGAR